MIDLKENKWQKRREDAGPKTIEEIHADIKKEQLRDASKPLMLIIVRTGPYVRYR